MVKKLLYPTIIVLSSIIALIPLLQPGYFSNHEEFFPMFRLYELYRGLQAGYIFPRWGPDWAFGFGYPFFNFYAPFSYYFAAFWHWLGFGLVDSVKIVFGASIILSGLTMYLWAKEFWGREGGLISAVVYMYLPYRLTDIYTRGNLAESFAFIWLPLILYSTYKIINNPRLRVTGYGLLLSISFAALILTHNLTAVYFLPILAAYVLHMWIINQDRRIKSLLLATGYGFLALSLSAFFWFPALYDTRFVRTQDMIQMWYLPIQFLWSNIGHTEHFDFLKQQFYPVHGILIGGGILAVLANFILSKKQPGNNQKFSIFNLPRRQAGFQFSIILFSVLMITILIFFVTPLSQPVWEILPKQFHYIQFSWRLLIFVGLFVSFLCGSILYQFTRYSLPARNALLAWRARPVTGLLLVWLIASTLPRLQTVYALNALSDNDITIEKSWNWDKQFGTLGNTAQSEYLPKWVDKDNFQFSIFNFQKKQSDFKEIKKVSLENDGLVTFEAFYFPGWQAAIDNLRLPTPNIQPQEGTGFVQVPVPAGEHEVKIWFGSTSWRRWSEAVSIISLIGLISLISLICLSKRKSFQI